MEKIVGHIQQGIDRDTHRPGDPTGDVLLDVVVGLSLNADPKE
jgi:hypothetical protein